jgi:DNA repair protein RadD
LTVGLVSLRFAGMDDSIQLREYQQRAIDRVRYSFNANRRAPLLVLPTGGGKTICFSWIAEQVYRRGKRVTILVHRQELLSQASQKLASFMIPHGRIKSGMSRTRDYIQVASVQTLARRLEDHPEPDLIVIDEAHHATRDNTWGKILEHWKSSRILGVTATPIRLDGKGLGVEYGGFFDDLIVGPTVPDLIDQGFLVKPEVYAPENMIDFAGIRSLGGDWIAKDLELRMDRPTITGNAVEQYRKHANKIPAIAFCVSVAHAEHVAEQFRLAGFRSQSLDGKMDDRIRRHLISELGCGNIDVLTSCEIVSEGTDIPIVGAALLLRPTKSEGLYLQQVGRILRPYPGKRTGIILDHVSNCMRHGLPDDIREWSLSGNVRQKRTKEEMELGDVRVLRCVQCFYVYKAEYLNCPNCGTESAPRERTIAEEEGELKKIEIDKQRKEAQEKRSEVYNAKTFEELVKIAKERNYKAGWAKHIWKAREEKEKRKQQV